MSVYLYLGMWWGRVSRKEVFCILTSSWFDLTDPVWIKFTDPTCIMFLHREFTEFPGAVFCGSAGMTLKTGKLNMWIWWVGRCITEKTLSLMIQMYPIPTTTIILKDTILLQSCGFYVRFNHRIYRYFWTCILLEWKNIFLETEVQLR